MLVISSSPDQHTWCARGLWQWAMASYLQRESMSHFYWALNDNSFKTGGALLRVGKCIGSV